MIVVKRGMKRSENNTEMAAANSTEDSCDVASSQTSADSGASGSGKCTLNLIIPQLLPFFF